MQNNILKAWVTKHVLQQQFGSRPKTVKNTLHDTNTHHLSNAHKHILTQTHMHN